MNVDTVIFLIVIIIIVLIVIYIFDPFSWRKRGKGFHDRKSHNGYRHRSNIDSSSHNSSKIYNHAEMDQTNSKNEVESNISEKSKKLKMRDRDYGNLPNYMHAGQPGYVPERDRINWHNGEKCQGINFRDKSHSYSKDDSPDDKGACCMDGICFNTSQQECGSLEGIWKGLGTDCQTSPCNKCPVVDAGETIYANLTDTGTVLVQLTGVISDDGQGDLTYNWTQTYGPADSDIIPGSDGVSKVLINTPGIYMFTISVSDGECTVYDNINVIVSQV